MLLLLLGLGVLCSNCASALLGPTSEVDFILPNQVVTRDAQQHFREVKGRAATRYIVELRFFFGDTTCSGAATNGVASQFHYTLVDSAGVGMADCNSSLTDALIDSYSPLLGSLKFSFKGKTKSNIPYYPTDNFLCGTESNGLLASVAAKCSVFTSSLTFENYTSGILANLKGLQSKELFAWELYEGSSCAETSLYQRTFALMDECITASSSNTTSKIDQGKLTFVNDTTPYVQRYIPTASGSCNDSTNLLTLGDRYSPLSSCIKGKNSISFGYSVMTWPNFNSDIYVAPSGSPASSVSPTVSPAAVAESASPTLSPTTSPSLSTPSESTSPSSSSTPLPSVSPDSRSDTIGSDAPSQYAKSSFALLLLFVILVFVL